VSPAYIQVVPPDMPNPAVNRTLRIEPRNPDWEPAVTSLGLLAALLGQEYPRLKSNRERDKALFLKFKAEFPTNGRCARFLREHDIGAPFHTDTTNELDSFLETWDNAEHEFIDRRLETARKVLLITGRNFRRKLSTAITMDHRGWFSIGMDDMEMRPEMFKKRDELNRLSSVVYKSHQDLMRAGKYVE